MNFDNSEVSEVVIIKPRERVEGCELVSVEKKVAPVQGVDQTQMHFHFIENNTGAKFTHKEFDPTKGDDEERRNKSVNFAKSRISHILNRFISDSVTKEIKAQNWEEYIEKSIQALGDSYKGKVCALKIVAKGKYASFPNFPPFISTEFSHRDFSTNSQYDKYEFNTGDASSVSTSQSGGQGTASAQDSAVF